MCATFIDAILNRWVQIQNELHPPLLAKRSDLFKTMIQCTGPIFLVLFSVRENVKQQYNDNIRWIKEASKHKMVFIVFFIWFVYVILMSMSYVFRILLIISVVFAKEL